MLFSFFFLTGKKNYFFDSKMSPKSQKMKLQKRYLEVSNSTRDGVRAFFRFTAKQKNNFFFQMSQKKRLEILRCVVVLKVFSKKRSFSVQKTRPQSATILNPSRPGTLCSARPSVAVCYDSDYRPFTALLPARNKQILPGLP
jgi:hypothetical protein